MGLGGGWVGAVYIYCVFLCEGGRELCIGITFSVEIMLWYFVDATVCDAPIIEPHGLEPWRFPGGDHTEDEDTEETNSHS